MAKLTGAGYLVGLVLLICLIILDSRPAFSGEGKSGTGPGPVMLLPEKEKCSLALIGLKTRVIISGKL